MHGVRRNSEDALGRQSKFTREELVAALKESDGDLTRAAVALGVAPSTVYRAMVRYEVQVQSTKQVVAA